MIMKIAIIGAGNTGTAIAYTLVVRRIPNLKEIAIIDLDQNKQLGEILDLSDAISGLKSTVSLSSDVNGADYVIVTAGKPRHFDHKKQKFINDRDLYHLNRKFAHEIGDFLVENTPHAKILVVTNPSSTIATIFTKKGLHAFPMGLKLDEWRGKFHTGLEILEKKGFTNWGIAIEVLQNVCPTDHSFNPFDSEIPLWGTFLDKFFASIGKASMSIADFYRFCSWFRISKEEAVKIRKTLKDFGLIKITPASRNCIKTTEKVPTMKYEKFKKMYTNGRCPCPACVRAREQKRRMEDNKIIRGRSNERRRT